LQARREAPDLLPCLPDRVETSDGNGAKFDHFPHLNAMQVVSS
jgi:hypothetical protein